MNITLLKRLLKKQVHTKNHLPTQFLQQNVFTFICSQDMQTGTQLYM